MRAVVGVVMTVNIGRQRSRAHMCMTSRRRPATSSGTARQADELSSPISFALDDGNHPREIRASRRLYKWADKFIAAVSINRRKQYNLTMTCFRPQLVARGQYGAKVGMARPSNNAIDDIDMSRAHAVKAALRLRSEQYCRYSAVVPLPRQLLVKSPSSR